MPNLTVEDILKHFGVKGMKWGVRNKSSDSSGPSRKTIRKDKKFERRATSLDTKIKLNNAVTEAMTNHIHKINADFDAKYPKEIENGVLLNRDHPITKKYHKAYNDAAIKELNSEASKMINASGTKKYKAVKNPDDFLGFTVITVDVKHEDDPDSLRFLYIKDNKGRIVGLKLAENSTAQSAIDDILEHHGIKGMKWGVRRSRPSAVTVSDKGKKLKTSGGHGRPATDSAVRARVTAQVAKKSGVKALTDQELRDYANRIQLEQNVSRLMYNEKSRGAKFVDNMLGRQGSQLANEAAKQGATKTGRAALGAAKKSRRVAKVAATVAAI